MEEKVKEMKKKCPQFVKADLYTATDVFILLALILMLLAVVKKEKDYAIGMGLVGMAACASFVTQTLFGKTKLKNSSENSICAKPEKGDGNVDVTPGSICYDIDGVKSNGTIYKISDGCHAVVKKDGTVKVKSLTAKFMNHVMDGGVLSSPPDDSWNKLFDC